MSRSGYSDDCDGWELIRWRGAVNSAIRGARGQAFLRELAEVLDAMPVKTLVRDLLVTEDGEFCALGVLGAKRGIDIASMDPEDAVSVAEAFDIAPALVKEIVFENDEGYWRNDDWISPSKESRWQRMRQWVAEQIKNPPGEKPHD